MPQLGVEGDPLRPVTIKCGDANEIQLFNDIVVGETLVSSFSRFKLKVISTSSNVQ
jgi:hypothetical protein